MSATKSTTLYDAKLTPVITETPDSISIGNNTSSASKMSKTSLGSTIASIFGTSNSTDTATVANTPTQNSKTSLGSTIASIFGTSNSAETATTSTTPTATTLTPDNSSFFEVLKDSYTFLFLLFLIFAVLGINIFAYLGYLTDDIITVLRPVIFVGIKSTSELSQDIISNSAEGTKTATDLISGTINSAIDTTSKVITQEENDFNKDFNDNDDNELEEETINNYKKLQKDINENNKRINSAPEPDDATSSTQKNQGKSGFCYIGEDRGFRSCIEVGENDTCMSGDIFPTKQICINPSLREGTEKY